MTQEVKVGSQIFVLENGYVVKSRYTDSTIWWKPLIQSPDGEWVEAHLTLAEYRYQSYLGKIRVEMVL